MVIEYHSEIAVVLEYALNLPTTIKALEITRLDIMNFLTLLPPQRLSVEDCKS